MEAVLFFTCAALALAGALGVVLARNPVHAVLFLLVTLVTMAVFFLMQDADLVAIIQIVVYAGAVVVLFVFVITLLGVDREESLREPLPLQRPIAVGLGVLLLVEVVALAGNEWATGEHSVRGPLDDARTGNVETLARSLFTDFIWAFEITAVLLVIAVVGGVVLARRSRPVPTDRAPEGGS
ncbi:MAG TPA: NADH-quinone oxidoreductase subunit J [Acidimicrobiia bacterium]|nr:NADH-quinone oxidoreductase subunit J [Acidimicrobiia bacterium]